MVKYFCSGIRQMTTVTNNTNVIFNTLCKSILIFNLIRVVIFIFVPVGTLNIIHVYERTESDVEHNDKYA